MKDVTFIMVNRGGTEIQRVIKNFNNTFSKYFSNVFFVIIEQYDSLPFKRGQLYNIGVTFCDTEYIGLIDNDIINLDSFDPIQKYNELNGPYVAFDTISQIKYDNENKISIIKSEKRLSGFGAFDFMRKEDFMKVNGFSNLCIGWGAEDNILNEKIKFKRFIHTLGHIEHPRRVNNEPKLTEHNRIIHKKYKNKEIDCSLDGVKQTTFDIVSKTTENDVTTIKVCNIGICNDFKYIDLYRDVKKIEEDYFREEDGYSICITAYKTKEYIKECLDSVFSQTWFKTHSNWEVIVGIDGCGETLEYVKSIMDKYNGLRVYMMDSNKGTYITTNTIMNIAKYNKMIRFDSDDIMKSNMIEEIDKFKSNYDYINMKFECFGNKQNWVGIANGCAMITKKAFARSGGYQPWECAADYDLAVRMNKLVKCGKMPKVVFKRRIRNDSLQHSNETGMQSEKRKEYHKYIEEETEKHLTIGMITNTFRLVYASESPCLNDVKCGNENKKTATYNAETTPRVPIFIDSMYNSDFENNRTKKVRRKMPIKNRAYAFRTIS